MHCICTHTHTRTHTHTHARTQTRTHTHTHTHTHTQMGTPASSCMHVCTRSHTCILRVEASLTVRSPLVLCQVWPARSKTSSRRQVLRGVLQNMDWSLWRQTLVHVTSQSPSFLLLCKCEAAGNCSLCHCIIEIIHSWHESFFSLMLNHTGHRCS